MDNWGGVLAGGLGGLLVGGLACGNGGLFGGGERGRCATTEEVAAGFNFAGVNNGLKDLMMGQAGINQNLGNAVCQSTYELGSKIDACCCNTQLAVKDLLAAIAQEGGATRTLMLQQENENLRQADMKNYVDKAVCGIPRVSTAGWGVYPLTCQTGCGCGNGAY